MKAQRIIYSEGEFAFAIGKIKEFAEAEAEYQKKLKEQERN